MEPTPKLLHLEAPAAIVDCIEFYFFPFFSTNPKNYLYNGCKLRARGEREKEDKGV